MFHGNCYSRRIGIVKKETEEHPELGNEPGELFGLYCYCYCLVVHVNWICPYID